MTESAVLHHLLDTFSHHFGKEYSVINLDTLRATVNGNSEGSLFLLNAVAALSAG